MVQCQCILPDPAAVCLLPPPAVPPCRKSVLTDPLDFTKPWWNDISEEAKDFVSRLLERDPERRPTAKQALEHPWLRGTSRERSTGESRGEKGKGTEGAWRGAGEGKREPVWMHGCLHCHACICVCFAFIARLARLDTCCVPPPCLCSHRRQEPGSFRCAAHPALLTGRPLQAPHPSGRGRDAGHGTLVGSGCFHLKDRVTRSQELEGLAAMAHQSVRKRTGFPKLARLLNVVPLPPALTCASLALAPHPPTSGHH